VRDRSGKSIVIEPLGGTLKVFDAPLGVITNAPAYDWRITNLRNYVNLSVTSVPPLDLAASNSQKLGQGAGMPDFPVTSPRPHASSAPWPSAKAKSSLERRRGRAQGFHI
jgi:penicillin V acylase-like amidase (Ntn superfamily)